MATPVVTKSTSVTDVLQDFSLLKLQKNKTIQNLFPTPSKILPRLREEICK